MHGETVKFTVSKCFYMYLAWRLPTWAETCCFNKHQNFCVDSSIYTPITRSNNGMSVL